MFCLVAAEPGAAEVIRENLQNVFTDWIFETYTSSGELRKYGGERPDVLLLSRFLPGEDILQLIPVIFPASQIVLLTGTINEQAKTYVRRAKQYGLENIVTGKLPGDKPYTIFTALTQARLEVETEEKLEWAEETEESVTVVPNPNLDPRRNETAYFDRMGQASNFVVVAANKGGVCKTTVANLDSRKNETGYYHRMRQAGNFIVVVANKGGVGKTTVAISLSLVTARTGIPTVLVDFDFGGPNVGAFFNIQNKPGIEKMSGKKYPDRYIKDLLIEVAPNLVILPGPQDKTMPYFEPEQLTEIVNVLSEEYLVIGDTPAEFWTKPWLEGLFSRADLALAVVDQSKFSEVETKDYAPKMLMMGVEPEKIRIVCNRFNSKLHNVKKVESFFNSGFKKIKRPPQVIATIPENWVDFVQAGYKSELTGIDNAHSPWETLGQNVARSLSLPYRTVAPQKKNMFSFFRRR